MKKLLLSQFLLLISILSLPKDSFSQNIGIGTNEPFNKLHVTGSLLINTPMSATNTSPTAGQTQTMVNAITINFLSTDSTGRIYDPGGAAGNYLPNIIAYADINPGLNTGIELVVETMDLGTGDSLIIKNSPGGTDTVLAVGNGYTSTGKLIFNLGRVLIIFKSNADATTGAGFSLRFRRLYDNSSSIPAVSGNAGRGLFFDAKNGAFRSGMIYNSPVGSYSVAMGNNVRAMGNNAVAMGNSTIAGGTSSVAIGHNSQALGSISVALGNAALATADNSVAIGFGTYANGDYSFAAGFTASATGDYSVSIGDDANAAGDHSVALGHVAIASGAGSTALGGSVTASGLNSTAMGHFASTNGHANSFVIGGTGTSTFCTSPNQFMTRFDNYTFWISASNYAYLLPASNGWAYTSDKNKKERFEELDGESVLKKLSNIPFCSWNFKAADTRQYRHYGIAAQDFYTAFGRDSYGSIGNDTTVSPLDLLGVAYSAIKALEKRTTLQEKENDQLKTDNLALQKRLVLLEAKLDELVAVKEEKDPGRSGVAKNK